MGQDGAILVPRVVRPLPLPRPRIRPPRPLALGRDPTGLGGEEPLGRSITRVLVVGKGLKDLKHRDTKDTERKEEVLKALCSL